jgi:hypothetical protein
MIERAELPVQRNSTLKGRSGTGLLPPPARWWRHTTTQLGHYGRTDFSAAMAAVAHKKPHHGSEALKISSAIHHAPFSAYANETCPHQDGQVRGHGVVRDLTGASDLSGREFVRVRLYETPENLKPGPLR